MSSSCCVENLGHLGIIASIFKEYRILEKIDSLLPKNSNNKWVSHGQVVLAMILQGLGFSSQRIYLSSEFLSHVAMGDLFGPHVKAEHFGPATIGRTLDAIYEYGATRFFTDTCLGLVLNHKLRGWVRYWPKSSDLLNYLRIKPFMDSASNCQQSSF